MIPRRVEKPWGRKDLPPFLRASGGQQVGEIWFEPPGAEDLPLLTKYLFTSEPLSVQVHPDDTAAQRAGGRRGKTECWYVLAAEPNASIALGFSEQISRQVARDAALDGSIETLLTWHSVQAGDCIFVPAGTVHAIGAGLSIIEVQQNSDLTYRLFDHGRPRPLHIEQALDVANLGPSDDRSRISRDEGDGVLVAAPQFTVARVSAATGSDWLADRRRWVLPLSGTVCVEDDQAEAGDCLLVSPDRVLDFSSDAVAIVAASSDAANLR